MQNYLIIGGSHDGQIITLQTDRYFIRLPIIGPEQETYVIYAITVGRTSVPIFRHESLTDKQVLDLIVKYYQAWCVNRPGGRL